MKIIEFPESRQTYSYDCGARAIEAVLAYYGFDVREENLMKMAGTNSKRGTPVKGIVKVAEKYGLKCEVGKMTIEQIKKFINKKIPVIVVLQAWTGKKEINWEKDWIDGHYVIAIGYDKHRLYFSDPSSVLRTYLTYGELKKRWHDLDIEGKKYLNYGIVVYGKNSNFSFNKTVHMG